MCSLHRELFSLQTCALGPGTPCEGANKWRPLRWHPSLGKESGDSPCLELGSGCLGGHPPTHL